MARLPIGQKPIVMSSYPHMLAEDTVVWSKYLAHPVAEIKEVWYDVHVGKGMEVAADAESWQKRMAAGVSRKRIDAVCQVGGGFWVVEIKPFASFLALGQVLAYTRLFIIEYRPAGQTWPVVVCDHIDGDMVDDFEDSGVVVIEI